MTFDQSQIVLERGMFGSGLTERPADQIRVHYNGVGSHIAREMALHNAVMKASEHTKVNFQEDFLNGNLPDRFWMVVFKELEKEDQYIHFEEINTALCQK